MKYVKLFINSVAQEIMSIQQAQWSAEKITKIELYENQNDANPSFTVDLSNSHTAKKGLQAIEKEAKNKQLDQTNNPLTYIKDVEHKSIQSLFKQPQQAQPQEEDGTIYSAINRKMSYDPEMMVQSLFIKLIIAPIVLPLIYILVSVKRHEKGLEFVTEQTSSIAAAFIKASEFFYSCLVTTALVGVSGMIGFPLLAANTVFYGLSMFSGAFIATEFAGIMMLEANNPVSVAYKESFGSTLMSILDEAIPKQRGSVPDVDPTVVGGAKARPTPSGT